MPLSCSFIFLAAVAVKDEEDAITHVVRCFDDPNVIHVAGKIDPTELALFDFVLA